MALAAHKRRYLLRMAAAAALYLVSLFAADYLIEDVGVSDALAFALAVVPGIAVAGFLWAIAMHVAEQDDEFLRMLMVRQLLIATGIALTVASVWGFLEEYELVGHVESFWVFVIWCFSLPVGMIITRITHGTWGDCW
jgi:hypothetical protein